MSQSAGRADIRWFRRRRSALGGEPAHYVAAPQGQLLGRLRGPRRRPWQLASVGHLTMTLNDGDAEGFRTCLTPGHLLRPSSLRSVSDGGHPDS